MTIQWVNGVPANTPATDQPNMLANNNNVPIYMAIDHQTFGAANSGIHTQVHMNANQASPGASPGVGVLYANTGVPSGSQLFWDNGTPSSNLQIPTILTTNVAASGAIKIGNVIINWGTATAVAAGGSVPQTFAQAYTNPVYSVIANPKTQPTNHSVNCNTFTTTGFTLLNGTGNNSDINWIAIGV